MTYSKFNKLITIIGVIFIFGFLNDTADAKKTLKLTLSSIASEEHGSETLGAHLEYGEILYNNEVVGNYRVFGSGYIDNKRESVKSGDIYLELYGNGYLFLKVMSSIDDRDFLKGIVVGGTDKLKNVRGTVTLMDDKLKLKLTRGKMKF